MKYRYMQLKKILSLTVLMLVGTINTTFATDYVHVMLGAADGNGHRPVTAKFVRTDTNGLGDAQLSPLVNTHRYWKASAATLNSDGTYKLNTSSDNEITSGNHFTGNDKVCFVTYDDYDSRLFTTEANLTASPKVYRITVKDNAKFMYAQTAGVYNTGNGSYTNSDWWVLVGDPYCFELRPYSQRTTQSMALVNNSGTDEGAFTDGSYFRVFNNDAGHKYNKFMLVKYGDVLSCRVNQYQADGTTLMGFAENTASSQYLNWYNGQGTMRSYRGRNDGRTYFVRVNTANTHNLHFMAAPNVQDVLFPADASWVTLNQSLLPAKMRNPFCTSYQYYEDAALTSPINPSTKWNCVFDEFPTEVYVRYTINSSTFISGKSAIVRVTSNRYIGEPDASNNIWLVSNAADATKWVIKGTPYNFTLQYRDDQGKYLSSPTNTTLSTKVNPVKLLDANADGYYQHFFITYSNDGGNRFAIFSNPGSTTPITDARHTLGKSGSNDTMVDEYYPFSTINGKGEYSAELAIQTGINYNIVTLDRTRIALTHTRTDNDTNFGLPAEAMSPLAYNWRYWKTATIVDGKYVLSNEVTGSTESEKVAEVSALTDVYVTYDYNNATSPVDLTGAKWYQMRIGQGPTYYYYYNNDGQNRGYYTGAAGVDNSTEKPYLWHFTGGDPYNVYVSNYRYNHAQTVVDDYPLKANSTADAYGRILGSLQHDNPTPHMLLKRNGFYQLAALCFNSVPNTAKYVYVVRGNSGNVNDFYTFYMAVGTNYVSDNDHAHLTFTEVPIADFNFHLPTRTRTMLPTVTEGRYVGTKETITLPTQLERKYIDSWTYYTAYDASQSNYDDRFSGQVTSLKDAYDGGHNDIYVKYTVGTMPFDVSTDRDHARWYRLVLRDDKLAHLSASTITEGEAKSDESHYTYDYLFAFFGDPYELQIVNRAAAAGQYLGVPASSTVNTTVAPRSDGILTWEMLNQTGYTDQQFALREQGSATTGAVYMAYADNAAPLRYTNKNTTSFEAVALPQHDYTYHIVDRTGRIAIKTTVTQDVVTPIAFDNLPATIRSPYIDREVITGYLTATSTGSTSYGRAVYDFADFITDTPADGDANIYIRYTTDHVTDADRPLRLDGSRSYNVYESNNKTYAYASSSTTVAFNNSATSEQLTTKPYVWVLTGSDPYAMMTRNVEHANYLRIVLDGGGAPSFSLTTPLESSAVETHTFSILLAPDTPANEYHVKLAAATGGTSTEGEEIQYLNVASTITYHIVDRSKKIVITAQSSNGDLEVPAEVRSPLVSRYHYYKLSNFDVDGSTYTLQPSATELTSIGEVLDNPHIYVTYEVSNEEMFAKVKVSGTTYTHVQAKDENESAPTYMIRFLTGESFNQENESDGFLTEKSAGIYPYNNGDGALYVYGKEQWDNQLAKAATTRGRWLWFIESETMDPYHVYVASRQGNQSHFSYLRTYQPHDYTEVVTNVITGNTSLVADGSDDSKATRHTPTEYMILGTPGHGRFVTVDPLSGTPDDNTIASRQTITSFEQYWKNQATAQPLLADAGEEVTAEGRHVTLTASQKAILAKGQDGDGSQQWHTYLFWANSHPWVNNGDANKTTSRMFKYEEHWFQTISMGTGEFTLEEVTLDPVLVLLDQHGWEIMRTILPKKGPEDPDRRKRYDALKAYDSPMVERYHYWKNGSKVEGYHRFIVSDYAVDENGNEYTTEHLGDMGTLPDFNLQGKLSNGDSRDWYVTYDVKPEYANAYQGAATEQGTQASAFMLIQNDRYLQATDQNTVGTTTAPASFAAIADEELWYLRPNFNIDREMGYLYNGEPGAKDNALSREETEAQHFAEGRNGFDPYNVQVQSKKYNTRYLTSDMASAALNAQGGWTGTYNSNTLSLKEQTTRFNATGHDQVTLNVTNATYMVLNDRNGHMRLVPRFDHHSALTSLTTLADTLATSASEASRKTQELYLAHPIAYTYHVVNKNGREAITWHDDYMDTDPYTPALPTELQAYGATNFRYLPLSEFDDESLTRGVYRLVNTKARSRSPFTALGNQADIYVVYDVNTHAITDKGFDGNRIFNLKLQKTAEAASYITYASSTLSSAASLTADQKKVLDNVWRVQANGNDPYDVGLYSFRDTENSLLNQRYIIGVVDTTSVPADKTRWKYELLVAGSEERVGTTSLYSYLTFSGEDVAIVRSAERQHGNLVSFSVEPVQLKITYKLYDLSGNLTLQGDVDNATTLTPQLPEKMRSPLVKEYYYYQDDNQSIPLTSLSQVIDNAVYVGYLPYTPEEAGLKLDGSQNYTLFNKTNANRIFGAEHTTASRIYSHSTIYYKPEFFYYQLQGRQVNGVFDPYDVAVYSVGRNRYWSGNVSTGSGNLDADISQANAINRRFMIVQGDDGYVEILQKKLAGSTYYPGGTGYYQYVYVNGSNQLRTAQNAASYAHGNENLQFRFQQPYTYHILNLEGKEAITGIEGRQALSGTDNETKITPQIPAILESPLVEKYHYYDVSSFNIAANGTYTLREGATELQYVSDATTSDIFVLYTQDELNHDIDLSGTITYQMKVSSDLKLVGFYDETTDRNHHFKLKHQEVVNQTTAETANYLWQFNGNDPYNVKIFNTAHPGQYISCNNRETNGTQIYSFGGTPNIVNSFMLLKGYGKDEYKYRFMSPVAAYDFDNSRTYQYIGLHTHRNTYETYEKDLADGAPNQTYDMLYCGIDHYHKQPYYFDTNMSIQFCLTPMLETTVTYNVINRSGATAIVYKTRASKNIAPQIPEDIRSPYAKNFQYWSDAACTSSKATIAALDNIYVTYEVNQDSLDSDNLDLTGTQSYNLQVNGMYFYNVGNRIETEAAPERFDDGAHEWFLQAGGDPYNVRLQSKADESKYIQLADYSHNDDHTDMATLIADNAENKARAFILVGGRLGYLQLLGATGSYTDASTTPEEVKNRLMYLGYNVDPQLLGVGSDDAHPVFHSGQRYMQALLRLPLSGITYHIINLSGTEAVRYTVNGSKGDKLAVPEPIRSPFATNWLYWNDAELREEANKLTAVPSANSDIYVTYTYNDDTRDELQLDGNRFYNMRVAGGYIAENEGSVDVVSTTTLTTEEANVTANLWAFDGSTTAYGIDPYELILVNKAYPGIYMGGVLQYGADTEDLLHLSSGENNFRSRFFLVADDPEGPYELVQASGADITNNVLCYVNRHEENNIHVTREKAYQHGHAALAIQLSSPVNKYLYKVMNRSGEIAIQAWGDGVAGAEPEIPAVIKSPMVSKFYYDVDALPYTSGLDEVVVTYDVDETDIDLVPNLLGTKAYNLKFRDDYFLKTSTGSDVTVQSANSENMGTPTAAADDAEGYAVWKPSAKPNPLAPSDPSDPSTLLDPYNITLKHNNGKVLHFQGDGITTGANDLSLDTPGYTVGTGEKDYKRFILLNGTEDHYQLMAATGEDLDANQHAYLGITSGNLPKLLVGQAHTQDRTSIQITLQPFRKQITYVVINNSNKQALRDTLTCEGGDSVRIPKSMKSPLLAYADYSYYDQDNVSVTTDNQYVTSFSINEGKQNEQISILPYENRTIYVRYNYTPKAGGLDLSGTVKYQMHANVGSDDVYIHASTNNSNNIDRQVNPADATSDHYGFRLEGNDPYNIIIRSAEYPKKLFSVAYRKKNNRCDDQGLWLRPDDGYYEGQNGDYWIAQYFMLLGHDDGGYRLMGNNRLYWQSPSVVSSGGTDGAYPTYFVLDNATASNRWNFKHYPTANGYTPAEGMQLLFSPLTTHNYRFHLTTKIDGRHILVEKEKVMAKSPFVIPEELMRKYCSYTAHYYVDQDVDADTQLPVDEDASTKVMKTLDLNNPSTLFPFFQAIDNLPDNEKEMKWVDIYIDYTAKSHYKLTTDGEGNLTPMLDGEGNYIIDPEGMPFNVMGYDSNSVHRLLSNDSGFTDYAFQISTYEQLMESIPGLLRLPRKDYLYFMVMKTNDNFTNGNGQYFLRREDNGRISYLNNDYKLHYNSADNQNGWSYSRCAESYRENDHDPFQEKHWLWCFAGDPYDFYIFNASSVVEETFNNITEKTEVTTHREHLVGCQSQVNKAGTVTEYVVNTPRYDEVAPTPFRWGLAPEQGDNSDKAFSLITGEFEPANLPTPTPAIPLYWCMERSSIDNMNEVMLLPRTTTTSNSRALDFNIQVLPYEPTKYQDVRLVIRRDDDVAAYKEHFNNTPVDSVADATERQAQMRWIDTNLHTGTVRMYSSTDDRMFAEGDRITKENIPLDLQRKFCDYKLYEDDFYTIDPEGYEVQDGAFRGELQRYPDDYAVESLRGQIIYNDQGKPMYNYYVYVTDGAGNIVTDGEGNPVTRPAPPQSVYIDYRVTTDKFLKKHPTKDEVREMVENNDHVYFMDFANPNIMKGKPLGYNTGHHAYYDEELTFDPQIDPLQEGVLAEKMIWDEGQGRFVYDTAQPYNHCQFRTADNRMESVPENLKWYFVGDPYKLQVYCTEDEFNQSSVVVDGESQPAGTVPSNLCRFDPTESAFQFVVDCVHFRTPDESFIDNRHTIYYRDENGNDVPVDNANEGKPYYPNFYWEVVPTTTDDKEAFALRFRADNQLLGYRDVYYYLAHDGLKRTYREAKSDQLKSYNINLSYDEQNTRFLKGKYVGYHKSNDVNCAIRLTEPTKVYFTAYKETYMGEPVVKEELSEYYGLGETITEVPRHLQRKYVKYGNLQYETKPAGTWTDAPKFPFVMSKDVAYNIENCKDVEPIHALGTWTFQAGESYKADGTPNLGNDGKLILSDDEYTKCRVSFKFRVTYEVDDLTADGIHLFTTPAEFANPEVRPQWLDLTVGGSGKWLYYDKIPTDQDPASPTYLMESDTLHVSHYPVAGYASSQPDGWDIGIKGLHWAFVGDPYKFNLVNRRRWEDCGSPRVAQPNCNFWLGTAYGQFNKTEKDAAGNPGNLWYNYVKFGDSNENRAYGQNGTGGNDGNGNTEWSLVMSKTGNAADFLIRTASPKTMSVSELVGDYFNSHQPSNLTNNYAILQFKNFTNLNGSAYPQKSSFVLQPFSLELKTKDINDKRADIRTAIAEDDDRADNDCFDANVHIYNVNGELKATVKHIEVTFGEFAKSLPATLRRYGCNYEQCYQLYYAGFTPTELSEGHEAERMAKLQAINERLTNLNNFTGENKRQLARFNLETLDNTKIITDENGRRYYEIAYVYSVDEDVEHFFTPTESANEDEYYWTNANYHWDQVYSGSNVRIVTYENVFDHYDYNADGHIINEVFRQVEKVVYASGDKISTPAYGWLNTHDGAQRTYADEVTQTEDNRQKWALVGDPYDFELKNYDLYLNNANTAMHYDANGDVIENSNIQKSHWTIAQGLQKTEVVDGKTRNVYTDAAGNTVYDAYTNGVANTPVYVYYLALIDDDPLSSSYGSVINYVTFDRAAENKDLDKADQFLYLKGAPVVNDPTATLYTDETKDVRPFYLADLTSFANMVVYHLVIAHQHSLDYDDGFDSSDEDIQAKRTIDRHLLEWLKYHYPEYMVKNNGVATDVIQTTYSEDKVNQVALADTPVKDRLSTEAKNNITELLKQASLRDVVNDEIPDYTVQRVGVGNALTVPWYMKRQFCNYTLYQRDVMRSETSSRPVYEEADDAWIAAGKATVVVGGITYKQDFTNEYADPVTGRIQKTFVENGITKRAYEVDWVSVTESPTAHGYETIIKQNGKSITHLDDSHRNRMVLIDVVYEVDADEFRFADKRRNTTAWYSMLTNNDNDGLLNFSYHDGVGARHDRTVHYTNNYLWAPEGDPYGFVLRSRYATINGTGWDNVAVTTPGLLPTATTAEANKDKVGTLDSYTPSATPEEGLSYVSSDKAVYTGSISSSIQFNDRRVTHPGRNSERATWGARNAVYEMFVGMNAYSFLMHPTSAYVDVEGDKFSSFYMVHNTTNHRAELQYEATARSIRNNPDANWRLMTTPEQLLPYFERAGYVGGLRPTIANSFDNLELYGKLQEYKDNYRTNPLVIDFKTIDRARELVYSGEFYKHNNSETPLSYTELRPTTADELPLRFVSNNLVPLDKGYFRLQAFSTDALNNDGAYTNGIVGPRYISGYRMQSEKDYSGYNESTHALESGSRWLHFFETDEEHTTFHTFGELNQHIAELETTYPDVEKYKTREITPHPALRGNIELLPVEYDPASVFYFEPIAGDKFNRVRFGTQNLRVHGRAGGVQGTDHVYGTAGNDPAYGATLLVDKDATPATGFTDKFRMDDIGGATITIRTIDSESASDNDMATNIQTNYLCIDGNHRYRATIHTGNELKEIGDQLTQWTQDGANYAIQDTKWMLQPVGTHKEWPYNQMPLRVKVQKGNQKSDSNGDVLEGTDNEDNNFYASLYVPYDTRLGSTIDVAFTSIKDSPQPKALQLSSVSQLNNMGNPQFIPASWPVIIRTQKPQRGVWMQWNKSTKAAVQAADASLRPYYVELDLPNNEPTVINESMDKIRLYGEYLEKLLTDDYIDNIVEERTGVAPTWSNGRDVMVFGLPFVENDSYEKSQTGVVAGDGKSLDYYAYKPVSAVGFYSNENWFRGHTEYTALTANNAALETAHLATARNATNAQRRNKYVYNNKVYLVFDHSEGTAPARPWMVALFGDEQEMPDDRGIEDDRSATTPWPCAVYDLAGRRVAERETPSTLLQNHPMLTPGVYIFGGRKVVVRK